MGKQRRTKSVPMIPTLGLLSGLMACSGPTDVTFGPRAVELDQDAEIVLAVGEDVRIVGTPLWVTISAVENDSRCPLEAVCVWQGDAEVRLELAVWDGPGASHTLHWNSSVGSDRATEAGWIVTLVAVEPVARAEVTIEQDEYRVRLRVERG